MFGTTLTEEYRRAAAAFGLGRAQLAELAANGVRASFLDFAAKQALLAEISAVAAGGASGAGASDGTGRPEREASARLADGYGLPG
jgi:aminodeoxyfutalosine deaminase